MYRCLILFSLIAASSLAIWSTSPCWGDFDRAACERACRTRYGGPGVFREDNSDHQLMSLDSCMQECERRFWEDFDRKTGETEKGDRGQRTR